MRSATVGRSRKPSSIARQFFWWQVLIVLVLFVVSVGIIAVDARRQVMDTATSRGLVVAQAVADSPVVSEAIATQKATGKSASDVLQPYSLKVMKDTGVDFVTIMSPDRIRYTHWDSSQIGKEFAGSIDKALAGGINTETFTGPLGPSVRSVVPVFDGKGNIVALVTAGITIENVSGVLWARLLPLAVVSLGILALGFVGSWSISRRLFQATRGVAPAELATMFASHNSVLHSVREGLLIVDTAANITLINDEAKRLLGVGDFLLPRAVAEVSLPADWKDLLVSPESIVDDVRFLGGRALTVNKTVSSGGKDAFGAVLTLRDHTDIRELAGQVDSLQSMTEALRSASHESANRLHTIVSLLELGRVEEAKDFALTELGFSQALTDQFVNAWGSSEVGSLFLAKVAEAHERGVMLTLESHDDSMKSSVEIRELVTIVGNLIDNGIEAALAGPPPREVHVRVAGERTGEERIIEIAVSNSGPYPSEEARKQMFTRGWSSKESTGRGIGLALVGSAVERLDGSFELLADETTTFLVRIPRGGGVA